MIKKNSIPPSTQDLKQSSRISVVFTPTGPLVYQSQVDWSTAQDSQAAAAGSFVPFTMINGMHYG